jgi:hypothetical protein
MGAAKARAILNASGVRPARLTRKQKALAKINRRIFYADYALRLGAAERVLMTDR